MRGSQRLLERRPLLYFGYSKNAPLRRLEWIDVELANGGRLHYPKAAGL